MKLSLLLPPKFDERKWTLARQIGIHYAITKAMPELSGKSAPWDFKALQSIKKEFREAGFNLYGLEGDQFDMSPIKLGLKNRDELIEKYCLMLRNMARLDIPLLCYNFMAGTGWYRSRVDVPERGGAVTSEFEYSESKKDYIPEKMIISEEKLWNNLFYFLDAVLPVAEANGISMALHPDDPPVSPLRGIDRILVSAENFDKIYKRFPFSCNGITFCQSCFHLMGEELKTLSARWLKERRIFFIHLRNITGDKNSFRECFCDNGDIRMAEMLNHYHSSGFEGVIRSDHAPAMYGEEHKEFRSGLSAGYEMLGHIFAVGYIKGICEAANIELE